jgi:ubiquinol-cytochrome c reductase cytochrome c1 subunit
MVSRTIAGLMALISVGLVSANVAVQVPLQKAPINIEDKASLQRGARDYVNYCLACHSLRYMRYNRMAQDLGLLQAKHDVTLPGNQGVLHDVQGVDDALVYKTLIFTDAKIYDFMLNAMPVKDAKEWFGVAPPDLTLETRVRGADWVYTYLLSFYRDPTRPRGVNNWLFPQVAMPNVLGGLQGDQIAVYHEAGEHSGEASTVKQIEHLQQITDGTMTQQQFQHMVGDITNFLAYAAEPAQTERTAMGLWVLGFMLVFAIIAYLLKREFWRDVKDHSHKG